MTTLIYPAVVGPSSLLLSINGVTVRATPPPPPNDVRILSPPLHQGAAALAAKEALESPLQPGAWGTLVITRHGQGWHQA